MANLFNLTAQSHTSRVLSNWMAGRPGAVERTGQAIGIQNATVLSSDNQGMRELFQPLPNPSGFAVTDRTAMLVSTVYACLSKLSGAILQLPVHQYTRDTAGDRQRVDNSALWWLLNESPQARWTAASWKEWIVRCVHLRGDQHTEIIRSRGGRTYGQPTGFKVHHPDHSIARRVNDRLVYDVQDQDSGKAYTVDQDDMLHFAGFGFDGLRSLSAIQYAARSAIGNSLAAAEYSGRSIGEGAMPQIALTYPNAMKSEQTRLLRENFVATYTGTGSRKLPLVLTDGGSATTLSISPVDMQLLESRRFEREDICQALGVPPVLIGDNDKTSSWGTGIEQITLGFVKYTVKPHLCRWEEELNRKLFRSAGGFVEFELDGLLRGDSKAQAEAFRSALGGPGTGDGYMTINEIRRLKNLPPAADGNKLYKAPAKPLGTAKSPDPTDPTEPKEPA